MPFIAYFYSTQQCLQVCKLRHKLMFEEKVLKLANDDDFTHADVAKYTGVSGVYIVSFETDVVVVKLLKICFKLDAH